MGNVTGHTPIAGMPVRVYNFLGNKYYQYHGPIIGQGIQICCFQEEILGESFAQSS